MSMHGLFVVLLASCGGETGLTDADRAAALWDAIDGFSAWDSLDGWTQVVPTAGGAHGDFVQVWADGGTLTALESGSEIPDGGIIVKAGFEEDPGGAALDSVDHTLTVMQKIAGYDPDHGDWFWARLDSNTGAVDGFAGQESACHGCHEGADLDGDFVVFDDLDPAGTDTGS
jgi:hypothetical protein